MAILEKIRVKLGILISILIAVALLSFIIDPNTLGNTLQSMSKENNVGSIGGKQISYREYFTKVEENTQLMQALGQNVNNEAVVEQLRNMTWNQLFNEMVFLPKIEDAGFAVSDAEMASLFVGENPSPVIVQQPVFAGEDGMFSPEAVKNFEQQMSMDESGVSQKYWDYLKGQVYDNQMFGKYYAALRGSNLLNKSQIARAIADNNTTKDVDFVFVPISFGVDSSINVTSAEVQEFYKARKNQFKQPANRDIEYVMYEVVPSEADIDAAKAAFDALYEEFATTENISNFIALNSDKRLDGVYYSKADLARVSPKFAEYAFGGASQVSGIDSAANNFAAVRVIERKNMPDSVKVAFFVTPDKAEADSVFNVAKTGAEMAELSNGGWLTTSDLAANGMDVFAEAFDMKPGEVRELVIKQTGANLVLKLEEATKVNEKVQVAVLQKNINPSDDTYRDYLMKATELADTSDGDYDKFAAAVKENGLPVIPMSRLTQETKSIGVVDNARQVVHWVFDRKTKEGSVSDVITVDNKYYFVAAVTKARKEGQMAIADVKDQIMLQLLNEKKVAKLAAEMKEKVSGGESLEAVAEKLGTTVSHKDGVAFGPMNMSLDPVLVGAVASAADGTVAGPVEGGAGIYYFRVNSTDNGEFYTAEDAESQYMQKASYALQSLSSVVAGEADVKDNRAKFY